jgi:acyl carrier protein
VLDLEAAEDVAIEAEPAAATSPFAGREIVVSAAAGSPRAASMGSALARILRDGGAEDVVADVAALERAGVDLWIHVSDEALAGPDALRLRLADGAGPDRVLVSLRNEVEGDPDRDRAWEARLWVDRLLLSGARTGEGPSPVRVTALSVPAEATPASVANALGGIVRGGPSPEQRIFLSSAEQAARGTQRTSPLLAGLDAIADRARAASFDRAGFLALTLPERRAALLSHVREELAGVLGLGSERRDELDPALRLDALGLDSLMTMELFMGLGRGLELPLAADWFPSGPTLAEIAQVLARRLEASLMGRAT